MAEKITGYKDARPCTSSEQVQAYTKKMHLGKVLAKLIAEGLTDEKLLTDQAPDDQLAVLEWIASELIPSEKGSCEISSAELCQLLEKKTRIKLSNNAMKDAMLMAGFEPVDPSEVIWHYTLSMDCPAIKTALDQYREALRR